MDGRDFLLNYVNIPKSFGGSTHEEFDNMSQRTSLLCNGSVSLHIFYREFLKLKTQHCTAAARDCYGPCGELWKIPCHATS